VGFLQLEANTSAAPNHAQLDMPVQDRLRRFIERYFNNPESLINAVHFDYGPSGRLQVVIMLEIADILYYSWLPTDVPWRREPT
jgi:hypothetical protein